MLNSSVNSASYSNIKNDMYRIVRDVLREHDRQLEDIKNILIDIRDSLNNLQGEHNE